MVVKWQKWHGVVAIVALAGVGAGAFATRQSSPRDAPAALTEVVPAPHDLLCDLFVASPNASWERVQRGVGGAAGILPTSLAGVLLVLTDLDPRLATEIDGASPMFGAFAGDPSDPSVTLAMKLVDARRARALLVGGEGAGYVAEDAGGMTRLVPTRAAREPKLVIAISANGYLLAGRRPDDLARLGPYVTTTLPSRLLPTASAAIDVPGRALGSVLRPKLAALWTEGKSFLLAEDERARAERGRAPDFGDPAGIVATLEGALERRFAILGDLERLRVALEVTDDAVALTATLTPLAGDGPARTWVDGMRVGDASEVLALPAVSALALSVRDDAAPSAERAKEIEHAIASALGARLKSPDKLHAAVSAFDAARGDSFTMAVGLEPPSGIFVRAPLRDGRAADEAVRGTLELARTAPFKDLFRVVDVTSGAAELPGLGRVSVAMVAREPSKASAPKASRRGEAAPPAKPPPVGVAWAVEQADGRPTLALGAGGEPLVTLKTGGRPDRTIGDEPALRRIASAVGSDASTILIAQPLRLDPNRASLPPSPLGILVGKKGGEAVVRVEITAGLLREAARRQIGF